MLTIVIPTKNEEVCLPLLLASIKQQTVQPKQVVVADACSTDNTCKIAEEYGSLVVSGGMPGCGRNRGAEVAMTDLVLFLDADVVLQDPEFLEHSLGEILERKLEIATCDVLPFDGIWLDHLLHTFYNKYVRLWGSLLPHAPGFCIFIKKSVHTDIQGFDESVVFAEDHEYVRRGAKKARFGILKTKIPVSVRRMHRDGHLNILWKYFFGELHLVFLGPIRHHRFPFTFGHEKKK